MRTYALLALAHLIAMPAFAHEKDYARAEGKADCKVFVYDEQAVTSMNWTGTCNDGYAEGTGVMEWKYEGEKAVSRYEGGMRKGRWHGEGGYLKRSDGDQYEGGFRDGKYHGTGTMLTYSRRYDGEWLAGERHGLGKEVLTLGGSYEGQWKLGKFHGRGTVTYAGGRTVTAEFAEGRRLDQAPVVPSSDKEYRINPANSYYVTPLARSNGIPFSRSYDEMSAEQKQAVREMYLLDDNDEPPYPANGTQRLYERIVAAQQDRQARGPLFMHVHVDSSGSPTAVTTFASPDTFMTKWVANLLVKEKYKPGMCQGKPCAMRFPISVIFTSRDGY